ncbi:cupredoxin domain-containing protein [Mechercharimyces sp. CAU 1602]|uniref:cupredoxin domain-containing protein n=1 Tax=Mechercharimyces sp. CAU 1602 TaxID=2973933 RepID=UPI0021622D28|nr:cupredoxin domain-containing protein [Mechercharimyces sp. CAU 1602]MCS1351314.1 cupredoxin domain-containing protein [Mechercharimyces sp. CAU 1602]
MTTRSKQWLYLLFAFTCVLLGMCILLPIPWLGGETVMEQMTEEASTTSLDDQQEYHLTTVEYTTYIDEKKVEVYRFEPGTIVVNQGDEVVLRLHGIHGKQHEFTLEHYNIDGTVTKGKETTISFTADTPGTFRLTCHTHTSANQIPMVSYITVVKK